jgi:outer membrane autotransporter protein
MTHRSKLIKNLLATASTMAVLFGSVQNVSAAAVNTDASATPVSFAANIAAGVAGNGLDAGFVSGTDSLVLDAARTLAFNYAGLKIVGIDLATFAATTTLSANTEISAAISNGGTIPITFSAAKTLTLSGAVAYTGLSVDFDQVDGTVSITAAATGIGDIDNTTNVTSVAAGTVKVGANVTYANDLGSTNALKVLQIGDGAAQTLTLQHGGVATHQIATLSFDHVDSKLAIDSTNGSVTLDITNNVNTGVAAVATGRGKLDVTVPAAGDVTINGTATGTLGTSAAPLKALAITAGAAAGDAIFTTAVYSVATTMAGTGAAGIASFLDGLNGTTLTYSAASDVKIAGDSVITTTDFGNNAAQLILADGATLTGAVDDSAGGGALHIIDFLGDGTITGKIGENNPINTIKVGVAAKEVTLKGGAIAATTIKYQGTGTLNLNSNLTGDVDFLTNDGKLVVGNNVTITGAINNTGAGAAIGIVEFAGDATVTGVMGSADALTSVTLSGAAKTVTVGGVLETGAIVFDNATSSTLDLTSAPTALGTVTTNNKGTGILKLNTNYTVAAAIGVSGTELEKIIVDTDKTLTVTGGIDVYATITAGTADENTLTLSGASTIYGVGTSKADRLEAVNAGAGAATFKNDVFTKTLTISGTSAVSLDGGLTAETLAYATNDTTVTIGADQAFDVTEITGTGAGTDGTLELNGTRTVSNDIGTTTVYLKALTFDAADKEVNLNADIYAATVTATADTTLVLDKNVTVGVSGGTIDLSGATLNVGSKKLTTDSDLTFTSDSVIKVAYDTGAMGSIDNSRNTSAVDLDAVEINIDVKSYPKVGETFVIFTGGAAPTTTDTIVSTDNSPLSDFDVTVDEDNYTISLTVKRVKEWQSYVSDKAPQAVKDYFNALQTYLDKDASGQARAAGNEFFAKLKESSEAFNQAAERFVINPGAAQATRNITASLVSNVTNDVSQVVDARMASLESERYAENTGLAAGNSESKLGAWLKGFGSQASQKLRKKEAGYKAKTGGATVGFDMGLNEQLVAGIAFTHAESDLKHRDSKVGDKTSAKSNLMSVYTNYDVGNDMFVQAAVNAGSSRVVNKDLKILSSGNVVADGRYDVFTYGMNALVGYNFASSNNLLVTPLVGMHYQAFLESGYTETGAGILNQKVSKRRYDKITGKLGARLASSVELNGNVFTPEVHGFINHDFRNKRPQMETTLDGLGGTITTKGAKPDATSYNLGLGISTKSGNTELGIEYNYEHKSKFVGHQGAFKVRVNF